MKRQSVMAEKCLIFFVVVALMGCGGKPTSPTAGSNVNAADRAIIEKEWLTKDGQPRRHNLYPEESWWHSCSSIEKIELVESTDKGGFYRVIWTGETFTDTMPPIPGTGGGSSVYKGVQFQGISDVEKAMKGVIEQQRSVDWRGIPLPTAKTVPGARRSTGLHTSKMYVKDRHIDSVQLQFLSAP
jgi:hypothetical protein